MRTRRSSEREPADSLRDKWNVRGGWLPSLTGALEMKSTRRKNLLGMILLGILVLCGLVLAGYTCFHDRSFRQRGFDSAAWKVGTARARGEMVASLQVQSLLQQKTRDEVTALLGKPDEEYEGGLLRYRVDVGRRIAWEPFLLTLIVKLGENARVYRVEIVD